MEKVMSRNKQRRLILDTVIVQGEKNGLLCLLFCHMSRHATFSSSNSGIEADGQSRAQQGKPVLEWWSSHLLFHKVQTGKLNDYQRKLIRAQRTQAKQIRKHRENETKTEHTCYISPHLVRLFLWLGLSGSVLFTGQCITAGSGSLSALGSGFSSLQFVGCGWLGTGSGVVHPLHKGGKIPLRTIQWQACLGQVRRLDSGLGMPDLKSPLCGPPLNGSSARGKATEQQVSWLLLPLWKITLEVLRFLYQKIQFIIKERKSSYIKTTAEFTLIYIYIHRTTPRWSIHTMHDL